MLRQYHTSPFQGGHNPLRVGTVALGSIFRFPSPRSGHPYRTVPWIVEGFCNGTLAAAVRNPVAGFWEDRYISGRSHLALVRCLANDKRSRISVRMLAQMEDEGMGGGRYPDLPDVTRFHNWYRNRSRAA